MKKDLKRRIGSIALAAMMLSGTGVSGMALVSQTALPVYAAAATVSENGFECRQVGEDGFLLVKYTGQDAHVVIPEKVGGRTVEGINSRAFAGCDFIKSITLAKSIGFIHINAFTACTNLEEIRVAADNPYYASVGKCLTSKDKKTLYQCPTGYRGKFTVPSGIKKIQAFAFEHCLHITEVVVPKGVETIGGYAFYNCKVLKKVSIDAETRFEEYYDPVSCFGQCPRLTDINYQSSDGQYYTIDGVLFKNDQGQKTLIYYPAGRKGAYTVPDGTQAVDGFNDCIHLTGITFPNSVKSISGFSGCTGLTQVTIPKSVRYIGYEAFSGCTGLISVTLTPGAQIGDDAWHAFADCPNLQTLRLPKSVTTIDTCYDGGNNILNGSPNAAIYGQKGSFAEQYAKQYGIPFSTAVPKLKNNAVLASDTIRLGESVQVRHEGIDGKAPYQYAVYYKKASSEKWTKAQGYSTAAVTSFAPKAAVRYDVKVLVKDTRGKIIIKRMTLTVRR